MSLLGRMIKKNKILRQPRFGNPPPGCSHYWFNINGEYSNDYSEIRKTLWVFHCVASNPKNARRKFDSFTKSQEKYED